MNYFKVYYETTCEANQPYVACKLVNARNKAMAIINVNDQLSPFGNFHIFKATPVGSFDPINEYEAIQQLENECNNYVGEVIQAATC